MFWRIGGSRPADDDSRIVYGDGGARAASPCIKGNRGSADSKQRSALSCIVRYKRPTDYLACRINSTREALITSKCAQIEWLPAQPKQNGMGMAKKTAWRRWQRRCSGNLTEVIYSPRATER